MLQAWSSVSRFHLGDVQTDPQILEYIRSEVKAIHHALFRVAKFSWRFFLLVLCMRSEATAASTYYELSRADNYLCTS